ncbi:MAG TPA: Kazal-type serine protease inhibitor domain-containing protein, partial [Saprospiraceae bacterium]|nr:Kazal-type serine protease inhibitor domain-containing protein [Saprospiraceae bacterium]
MKNFYLVISQLVFAVFTISQLAAQCPTTYQPVCGTDGKTYLNACYAETAGVKFYTEGICYADCVEPSRMLPNASCALTFSPVYGCNGVLYLNECEARKHGVVSWTPTGAGFSLSKYGQCVVQQYVYPPSQGVAVANGQVALNCPAPSDPVCGCNGITYRNACTAEALGVLEYTKGPCNDPCIDPSKISSEDANLCAKVYDPVCGCNGMNYINNCFA